MGTILSRPLLLAGLAGGHLGGFACVLVAGIAVGRVGVASAMIASVVVIVFFTIGQGVVLQMADRSDYSLLIAALISYGVRVTGLGLLLFWYESVADQIMLDPLVVAVTIIVTVIAWASAEIIRFTRLRIPAYDVDPEPALDGAR